MELADLVAAVVVLCLGEIGVAALGLAPRGVERAVVGRPGPAVEPVHEVVLGREVGPPTEVEPDPRGEVGGRTHVLALGDQHEPVVARDGGVEAEHVVVVVVRCRRVGRRAGEDAGVEEGVHLVGLGLGLAEMLSEGRVLLLLRLRREEVVEGDLSGGVVVENAVVVVEVSVRVGSVNGLGSIQNDGGRVGPFVVQHFLSDVVYFSKPAPRRKEKIMCQVKDDVFESEREKEFGNEKP